MRVCIDTRVAKYLWRRGRVAFWSVVTEWRHSQCACYIDEPAGFSAVIVDIRLTVGQAPQIELPPGRGRRNADPCNTLLNSRRTIP